MQKLKKALKKLAHLGTRKPAQPAKKAASVKKKSQPVAAAKKPQASKKPVPVSKKPVMAGAAKKAAPAPKAAAKAPAAKPETKDLKKKPAAGAVVPQAAAKGAKATEKAVEKPAAAKVSDKAPKKSQAIEEIEAAAPKKAVEKAPDKAQEKAVKAKKGREEAPVAEAATVEDEEIILTDAEGRRYCRVKDCDQASTVDGYCRYHYLLFWKNIQNRKKILSEGKLERYIEELTARYPDKYLELLRKDLRSEKDFMSAIQELEIDDSGVDNEFEDEAQSFIDEVRGMGSESGGEREEDF